MRYRSSFLAVVLAACFSLGAGLADAGVVPVPQCDSVRYSVTAGQTVDINLDDLGCVSSDGSPITYVIDSVDDDQGGREEASASISASILSVVMPSYGTDDFKVFIIIEPRNSCTGGPYYCPWDLFSVVLVVDGSGIFPQCGSSVPSQDWANATAIKVPGSGTVAPENKLNLTVNFGWNTDSKTGARGYVGGLRVNDAVVVPKATVETYPNGAQTFTYPASSLGSGARVRLDVLMAFGSGQRCWAPTSEVTYPVRARGVKWKVFTTVDIGDPFVHFVPQADDCEGFSRVDQRITLTNRHKKISLPIAPQCSPWSLNRGGGRMTPSELRVNRTRCVKTAGFALCQNRVRRDITANPVGRAFRRTETFTVAITSPVSKQIFRCQSKPDNIIMMPTNYTCREVVAQGI